MKIIKESPTLQNNNLFFFIVVFILITIGIGRIIITYHIFSQTSDEPFHIARGYEWWVDGSYELGQQHPPFAPILIGLGPYLAGARSSDRESRRTLGNALLHAENSYFYNLTLARIGVLPFFILASIGVFIWCRRFINSAVGLIAVAIFTMLPPVLAHASFATTDMAITTTLLWAV